MKDVIDALSTSVDKEKLAEVNKRVSVLSGEVNLLVDAIVNETCQDLDAYMLVIDNILTNQTQPVSDVQLDDFTLNLPSLLYLVSSAQENLGIKDDVSKAIRNDAYNRVREKSQGTVADKDAAAELQAQTESVVNIVYNRAYKKVKLRVEAAWEMLNSVKKIISRRIAEYEMNKSDRGGVPRA